MNVINAKEYEPVEGAEKTCVFIKVSPSYMSHVGNQKIRKKIKEDFSGNYKLYLYYWKSQDSYLYELKFKNQEEDIVFRLKYL